MDLDKILPILACMYFLKQVYDNSQINLEMLNINYYMYLCIILCLLEIKYKQDAQFFKFLKCILTPYL